MANIRCVSKSAAVTIRIKSMNYSGYARFNGWTPVISTESYRAIGCTMVGDITRDDFLTPCILACKFDGILIRFGSAQGEKYLVEITRRDFGDHFCQHSLRLRSHVGMRSAQ